MRVGIAATGRGPDNDGSEVVTTIDNSDEVERARRKAYIEKIRKANDEAPRPTVSAVQQAKRRAGEVIDDEDEPYRFPGPISDWTDSARQAVLDQGRRNAQSGHKS